MRLRDARRSLALLLVASLALSACSGGGDERPAPPATAAVAPTGSPPATPMSTPAPPPTRTPSPTPTAPPSPTPAAEAAPPSPTPTATATPAPTATSEPATTETPSPTTFRYDSYDTTGTVAAPGSYAFLADPTDTSSAGTTYEALRDGTATALRIHTTDADGVSRAAVLDSVEAGHLIEWKQAEDCFVRYRVTGVPAVAATAAYREFRVRAETYAWQSCQAGSLPAGASAVQFSAGSELPLEHLGGTSLTGFAVVHGIRQLVPDGVVSASGALVPGTGIAVEPARRRELTPLALSVPSVHTADLAEARRLPYWREPRVPADWRFVGARSGAYTGPGSFVGYWATYVGPAGQLAVRIEAGYVQRAPGARDASWTVDDGTRLIVRELRMIAGRPATVTYSPLGPKHEASTAIDIEVYDAATGVGYIVNGISGGLGLRGGPDAAERVIAIVRSLFEGPNLP